MTRAVIVISALALTLSVPNAADARPTLVVNELDTPVECQTYASWWGLWMTTECQNRFATMRDSIESALIETQLFDVIERWSGITSDTQYDVFGTVTGLGTEHTRTRDVDYCISETKVRASINIRVVDRADGRVVYGGNVQKSIVQASAIKTGGETNCNAEHGQPFYEIVQRELSLAVARQVAFKIEPLTVAAVDGRKIIINRGKPLVSLGATLKVADANGFPQTYRVTATIGNRAIAEPVGRVVKVVAGAEVDFVEADDNDANTRRFEKVELP